MTDASPNIGTEHAADIIKQHWDLLSPSAKQRIRDEALRLSVRRHKAVNVARKLYAEGQLKFVDATAVEFNDLLDLRPAPRES